jgi:glutamyl-tRNA reductase
MKLWKNKFPLPKRLSKKLRKSSSLGPGRKFAPTINALKAKLNAIKASELDFQQENI